jgi:hypothetical protein
MNIHHATPNLMKHHNTLQGLLHNKSDDSLYLQESDLNVVGLHKVSNDGFRPLTTYESYLLKLEESHDPLLLNNISCYPTLGVSHISLTNKGANVLDYVLIN